jgi:magnesium chelatase accessory protein
MGFMAGADLPAMLERGRQLTIPTAFLLGKEDPWVRQEPLQEVIAKSFPTASVTVWPGGHVLHEADPKRVAEYLQTIALMT